MHHRLRLAASAAPPCTSLCVAFVRHINGLSRIGASARLSSLPSQQATSLAATVPAGADAAQRAGGMLARRSCFFSTSANSSIRSDNGAAEKEPKREYFIPTKRQYKSAPKRQHGIHAGWRKFSQPKDRPWHVKPKKGEEKRELAEVSTSIKGIRVSPWQLNLLAKVVRNLPVVDAVAQMEFGKKKHTETYKKIIQNACNLAHIRHGLIPEQLRVGEVFVTKGMMQKRMIIMGRGRTGVGARKWSHLNLTLREIDFDEEISKATTKTGMRKAVARKEAVEQAVRKARAEETGEEEPAPVEAEFADKS